MFIFIQENGLSMFILNGKFKVFDPISCRKFIIFDMILYC